MDETKNQKLMVFSFILGSIIIGLGLSIQLLILYGKMELAYSISILMGYVSVGIVIVVLYKIATSKKGHLQHLDLPDDSQAQQKHPTTLR